MDREQRLVHVFTQAVCALADIEGMKAENKQREICGDSMAYCDKDFFAVKDEYVLNTNDVVRFLHGD